MARMNFQPVMTFIVIVVAIVVLVYAMKNPNFKSMLTGIFQRLTGKGQQQQQQLQTAAPQQITPAPTAPTPPMQLPGHDDPGGDFTGRSTGPGVRSQDPVTQAINRCVGVGVNPPDPQAYNDCVNAAYPKASRARIGIA